MNKRAVDHIITTLGSGVIERFLGVSSHSVRAAKTKSEFPAIWYAGLKTLCDETGIPCPLSAFYWRGQSKNDNDQCVGAAPASARPAGSQIYSEPAA